MRRRPGPWWWPVRITFGLFFLHTALAKRELDEKGAKGLHRFASAAYPQLKRVEPATFVRGMTIAESTIAASLLVPVVPATVGAAGLTAFGVGLVGTYARVPGLRREGSVRPTEIGLSLAKDTWMVAAGSAALIDAWLSPPRARAS
ncbi:MAG TPA: hypothetical protein VFB78_17035 [Acidimicrobiales bacterium]|nr:hypothetical protein [Acidimicrobiales bacterium]